MKSTFIHVYGFKSPQRIKKIYIVFGREMACWALDKVIFPLLATAAAARMRKFQKRQLSRQKTQKSAAEESPLTKPFIFNII